MSNSARFSIYIVPDLSVDERESLIRIMLDNGEVERFALHRILRRRTINDRRSISKKGEIPIT